MPSRVEVCLLGLEPELAITKDQIQFYGLVPFGGFLIYPGKWSTFTHQVHQNFAEAFVISGFHRCI